MAALSITKIVIAIKMETGIVRPGMDEGDCPELKSCHANKELIRIW